MNSVPDYIPVSGGENLLKNHKYVDTLWIFCGELKDAVKQPVVLIFLFFSVYSCSCQLHTNPRNEIGQRPTVFEPVKRLAMAATLLSVAEPRVVIKLLFRPVNRAF